MIFDFSLCCLSRWLHGTCIEAPGTLTGDFTTASKVTWTFREDVMNNPGIAELVTDIQYQVQTVVTSTNQYVQR